MGPIKPRQVGWSMTDNMTSRHLSKVYCHRNRSGKEKNSHILRPTGWLEQINMPGVQRVRLLQVTCGAILGIARFDGDISPIPPSHFTH